MSSALYLMTGILVGAGIVGSITYNAQAASLIVIAIPCLVAATVISYYDKR